MNEILTSSQNDRVKAWRKLSQKKHRDAEKAYWIEGVHLLEEALQSGADIKEIIAVEGSDLQLAWTKFPVTVVSDSVFKSISQTPSPQGIAAVVGFGELDYTPQQGHLLLLDAVQDPGNLGTMIRTADAAGFSAVVLGKGCADLYNDKTIRATQGSLYHLPIYKADLAALLPELKAEGYYTWVTDLTESTYFHECEVPQKVALIMGNEGQGVSEALIHAADQAVKIPILGQAESLNVGIAAAVLVYHIALAHESAK